MRYLRKGDIVRHFKGNIYLILDFAEHTETGDDLVIYKALYECGKVYARPYKIFASKIDEGREDKFDQRYRFVVVKPDSKVK